MNNKNISISPYIIGIVILSLIVSAPYLFFREAKFSLTEVDWGSFGSYFGGIVGPIISAVTLVYLFNSLQHTNRLQGSDQFFNRIFIELDRHRLMVANYKILIYDGYSGIQCFSYLWNLISAKCSEVEETQVLNTIENQCRLNECTLKKWRSSFDIFFDVINLDPNLTDDQIKAAIKIIFRSLEPLEVNLLQAIATYDLELRDRLIKYNFNRPLAKIIF